MSGPPEPTDVLEAAALVRFAQTLVESPELWRPLVRPTSDGRVYKTIWSDDYVNAWVICWPGNSDTGFHDHDNSATGIVVIEGTVLEERLALAGPPVTRRYGAGESFHLAPSVIHRLCHAGVTPSLTIHAYSPPLRRQGVYSTTPDGALAREATPYTEELRADRDSVRLSTS